MQPVVQWLDDGSWPRWDRFAEEHSLGGLVQSSAWKAVLEQSFPHIRGQCCALVDDTSGTIIAGLPIYRVKSRILGTRLVSIPFATLADPLVANEEQLSLLMAAVRGKAPGAGARRIEIRCTHISRLPVKSDWCVEAGFKHHVLVLDRSPDRILSSVHSSSVRARIGRAEKTGLRYRADSSVASLQAFYRLFLLTRRRLALPPIPYTFFQALHSHLVPLNALSYALVESGPTLVAAGLVLKWRKMSAFEYLGDCIEQRRDGANQLLYWGAILDAIREGREAFSFGRTAASNEGLLEYKRRWGTSESDLKTLISPWGQSVPGALREDCWKYRLVRWLSANAPMPLYRLLGHFCYRHMG